MLDCDVLEYKICESLKGLNSEQLKGFWCDGVVMSEDELHYSAKSVNDRRFVILRAWLGKTGQENYSVKLKFGKKAVSRFQRGLSIQDCFPNEDLEKFISIDTVRKTMEIQLK